MKSFKNEIDEVRQQLSNLERQVADQDSYQKEILSLVQKVDTKTWEIQSELQVAKNETIMQMFEKNKVSYHSGEKIRIVFLFQIASFWPSIDTFFEECKKDARFDVKVVLYNEQVREKDQIKTAREFLQVHHIDFFEYYDFSIHEFNPHFILLQSPYDNDHRPPYLHSSQLAKNGYRVIYITYGIELSDTKMSHVMHFDQEINSSLYRLYCFSDEIKKEYFRYTQRGGEFVRSFGHPKFDRLFTREGLAPNTSILEKANGRKIILWKVHFPIDFQDKDGVFKRATPYLEEYLEFSKKINQYQDFFFVFMPHPKFLREARDKHQEQLAVSILKNISQNQNAIVFSDDDYRPALLVANAMIIDRSAVLIEAGAMDVPILYLHNADFNEPLVDAVNPLVNSYYQGTGYKDIEQFLFMCREGRDPQKEQRKTAFKQCVPLFDGKAGYRIKEDLVSSLLSEKYSPKNN